jgi:hypothetical protein
VVSRAGGKIPLYIPDFCVKISQYIYFVSTTHMVTNKLQGTLNNSNSASMASIMIYHCETRVKEGKSRTIICYLITGSLIEV